MISLIIIVIVIFLLVAALWLFLGWVINEGIKKEQPDFYKDNKALKLGVIYLIGAPLVVAFAIMGNVGKPLERLHKWTN